jgi:hypothetical protein
VARNTGFSLKCAAFSRSAAEPTSVTCFLSSCHLPAIYWTICLFNKYSYISTGNTMYLNLSFLALLTIVSVFSVQAKSIYSGVSITALLTQETLILRLEAFRSVAGSLDLSRCGHPAMGIASAPLTRPGIIMATADARATKHLMEISTKSFRF